MAPTIGYAREHGLDLAIRGGGHNVAGNGRVDDGIVLDLGGSQRRPVDPATATVRVEAGATLAHVDAATEPYGLVVPVGVMSGTGIAGLTLGGGVGWLTRPTGSAGDNLHLGRIGDRRWPADHGERAEHPDLFWALHGGGATSAWSPPSPSAPTRSGRCCSAARSSTGRTGGARRGRHRGVDAGPARGDDGDHHDAHPAARRGDGGPAAAAARVRVGIGRPCHRGGPVARLRGARPTGREEVGGHTVGGVAVRPSTPCSPRGSERTGATPRSIGSTREVIEVLVRRGSGADVDRHRLRRPPSRGGLRPGAGGGDPFPNRSARFWLNIYGFWNDPADDDARMAFVRGRVGGHGAVRHRRAIHQLPGAGADGHRGDRPGAVFGPTKISVSSP